MRKTSIKTITAFLVALACLAISLARTAGESARLQLRTYVRPFRGSDSWVEARFEQTIVNSRTAIIITDMWDKHWCAGATERVKQIATKMEPTLDEARRAGILIIHAPSDTMEFYAKAPGRLLAQNAPRSVPPTPQQFDEGPLPIDDSDEGCDTPGDKPHKAWSREIKILTIAPGDVISDKGEEIYNVLRQRNIDTLLYMGVHTNMCILNRSFGIRQMSKWGLRCILARDLTDAMYNPASRPYVSHAEGTELVIQHIERYWAPSVTSNELLSALRGSAP
ncbi:MAG TPA: isochorismatase [Blastocatellia bacterium]|jgi:nicotinamidase-related amidase|nr:isochorismatase [Blastocatellia bacterium]